MFTNAIYIPIFSCVWFLCSATAVCVPMLKFQHFLCPAYTTKPIQFANLFPSLLSGIKYLALKSCGQKKFPPTHAYCFQPPPPPPPPTGKLSNDMRRGKEWLNIFYQGFILCTSSGSHRGVPSLGGDNPKLQANEKCANCL